MKVVAFEIEDWEAKALQEIEGDYRVECISERIDANNAGDHPDAEVVSPFINSKLDEKALKQLKKLKLVVTRSTGYDHVDLDYCHTHGIVVCNVPDYGTNTVAEHVFGLLLTISHRLEEAIDRTRKGDFSPRGLQGFDLHGKTIGVVGTGDIGLHVIRIAKGFGMNVLAFDIAPREDAAEELGFEYCDLDDLLGRSDIITMHVPSNKHTRHMIAKEQFIKMKDKSVLINTARGDVVDIKAMVRALAEGKLVAAGLDVLPDEPVIREEAELLRRVYETKHDLDTLLANHIITHMRNVVVTPHSAFNTREAVRRIIDTTIDNIHAFARGEPINQVNA